MSHYNSYSKNSLKKYDSTPSYLSKKRSEHDSEGPSKKKYEYDNRYEKYDKYHHQCKYNVIKDYSQNYYHNSSKYRSRDSWYYSSKYHSKSPRREYKKSYQKYSNDTEGVRNLSHCELPPSPKNKKEENDKNGLIQGLNHFVSNIVSTHFTPRQGTYQHIFQNQQNINIEINLTSPSQLIGSGATDKRKRGYDTRVSEREREKEKESEDYYDMKVFDFPKPAPKIEIEPFDKSSIKIEPNPFDDYQMFPNKEQINPILSTNESGEKKEIKPYDIGIKSSYLLAKIPNWRLVTSFVSVEQLKEEKFSNIIEENQMEVDESNNIKYYLVYDEEIERNIEKTLEGNYFHKNKLKNECLNIMNSIEHCSGEVRKIQNTLFSDEWKTNNLDIKLDSIKFEDN